MSIYKYWDMLCKWGLRSKEFNTSVQYENPKEIQFSDALMRVELIVDTPALYSNEPVKDLQAWEHIRFCSMLGNKVMELRKEGKEKMLEWVNSLNFEDK